MTGGISVAKKLFLKQLPKIKSVVVLLEVVDAFLSASSAGSYILKQMRLNVCFFYRRLLLAKNQKLCSPRSSTVAREVGIFQRQPPLVFCKLTVHKQNKYWSRTFRLAKVIHP